MEKERERKKWERQTKLMKGYFICPACKGNGYRKIVKDTSNPYIKVAINCEACDNQGEVKDNEKNIFALRYLWNVV